MSNRLNTRFTQKYDTSANWKKAVNFIPLVGEIIIYSDLNNMKIGDGKTPVNKLSFLGEPNVIDWMNLTKGGNLDGFTVDRSLAVMFPVVDWNVDSGKAIDGSTGHSIGLYGWSVFEPALFAVGYYWDDNKNLIAWQNDLGAITEAELIAIAGANVRRFHIDTQISSAPGLGRHIVHFLGKLSNGEVIEFDKVIINVLG